VWTEVERPDDVEGHLAVETETLKADRSDLVTVLVEGTNLSLNHVNALRCENERERQTVWTEEAVMLGGRSEKGGRGADDCIFGADLAI
jgi:hypothetical protein